MKKLLLLLCLITGWLVCDAQTGAKPDWPRTPNGFNTIVDYNLKAKTLNLPHYLLTARRPSQDSIGTIFLNINSADPHIYIKRVIGSTYWPVAYLADTINYHFLPSTYNNGFYNTGANFANHLGINITNSSPVFGAISFIRVTQNNGWLAQMTAASSGFVGSGSLLQPNTVFYSGKSPNMYMGNIDSLGKVNIFAGMDYSTRQVTISIDSLRNIYMYHLGNSSVGGDSVMYIGVNGQLKKGFFHGVNSIFGRNGNVIAQSGDYNTSQVTESGNLYFTNARVLTAPLTGYTSGAGVISSSDNILTAIQKLNGNIAASVTGVSSFNTRSGAITLTTADVNGVLPTQLGTVTVGNIPYSLLSGTVPTWNQNTTGSAAKWTTARNVNGVALDGTANITITANTPGTHTNGYALLGSPFSGANQTWNVDTSKVVTPWALTDTINAHGATAGYGIIFASGAVKADTAASLVSKGFLSSFAYTKNQITSTNFTYTGFETFNPSVTASAGLGVGTAFTPTLNQAANADILVGVDVTPTVVPGAFTGAVEYGMRLNVGSTVSGRLSGLLIKDAATSQSGSVLLGSISGGGFSTPCMWFGANAASPTLSNYLFAYDVSNGPIFNAPSSLSVLLRINNVTFAKLTPAGYFQSTPLDAPLSLSAINSTATATAAQVGTGAITSTSAAATTITLPTATQMATQLSATRGFRFSFTVDNTAGANTVTMIAGSGMTTLSVITGSNTLTVATGVTGMAKFELLFSSATACSLARVE